MKSPLIACILIALSTFASAVAAADDAKLTLQPGGHVCVVGNTLAERMQHDGWLEARLHDRFPEHRLVIRNLGFSGDEVKTRNRVRNFGEPDEWLSGSRKPPEGYEINPFELTNTRADVVLAFFGFNESFKGKEGEDEFESDLTEWIQHTLSQKYNGETAPKLVLFSPIAHEPLNNRLLPDGTENNERLARYTAIMRKAAEAGAIPFVNLFDATREAYSKDTAQWTINGVHLNEHGNRELAKIIDHALFGPRPDSDSNRLEAIRTAVQDKNFHWFNRYRTTDGYSTYGNRAFLVFHKSHERNVGGDAELDEEGLLPTNYDTTQSELRVLDVMTSNRDARIWAAANGRELKVDDSNTPPFKTTETNKPGKGPGGSHIIRDGEEAIQYMKLAEGLQANLFASESMFPELINPVQMAVDTKGRLWVAVWPTYPHWKPKSPMNDKLLIFEDHDGDGKADECKTFAGDLHNPTGFEFWNNGVLVAQGPDLTFLQDVDGDDKADVKKRMLHGLCTADTHHTANSFTFDPGGALYWQEGTFHRSQIESPYGIVRNLDAAVWRFEPSTYRVERYIPYGFANPHGHVFDAWGQDIVHDGTGAVPYHGALFSVHAEYPRRHPGSPTVYRQRTRPCSGTEILSSRHFPERYQGNLLVGNVIGFLGVLNYELSDDGASIKGEETEPIIQSEDPNFRPSDLEIGADGALYIADWHNPIIGHMQHNLRDPSRDKRHGRVYRITHQTRPLLTSPNIASAPVPELLELLRNPENRVRYRAKIELSGRGSEEVVAALKEWIQSLDSSDANHAHHLLEALWVHQWHHVVNEPLLDRVLKSPDFRARAAAVRVLCSWRHQLPNALDKLAASVVDEHPRVRLEAVRACSFFETPRAAEIALESLNKEPDRYLEYTLEQTMKTLDRYL